jgi:hypothetical protein
VGAAAATTTYFLARAAQAGSTEGGRETLKVKAGDDLQEALRRARPGDTLVLEAGATFAGPITLPKKEGDDWITIRSSALAKLPREGRRILPAHAVAMPKIVSPGEAPALRTEPGAHHFRFVGVEFRTAGEETAVTTLISLGAWEEQTALDQVPHHLVFDRCYIHAYPDQQLRRGIALNSADTRITGCHIAGFKVRRVGDDAQAIGGWNGPGPYQIINNYLEAGDENIMFGGADPTIPGLVPSDIEIRRNHLFKPLSWRDGDPSYAGTRWAIKNLLELKNARRVVIDGNVLENSWVQADQSAFGVLFTVRNQDGAAPWCVIEDVRFTNNIVRHTGSGVQILGRDDTHPSEQAKRIVIENNLFEDIDGQKWGGDKGFVRISEAQDVRIAHNTVLNAGDIISAHGRPTAGLVFTGNLVSHNEHGMHASGANPLLPGAVIRDNVIVGGPAEAYPGGNHFPPALSDVGFRDLAGRDYRLAARSPYRDKAAGGKEDIGCNFDALRVATKGVTTPMETPGTNP